MRIQKNWSPGILLAADRPNIIDEINEQFDPLSPAERLQQIFNSYAPEDILVTSSFGSSSAILIHMLQQVRPEHPVHFINTSFHFQETLGYKQQLTERFGLNVIDIGAAKNKNQFTHDNQTWRHNQDLCCFINKVAPLNELRSGYKIWISGLMAFQNANRRKLRIFEPKEDILKVHPLIDMSSSDAALYQMIYELPSHPLVAEGYDSIGCKNCTQKGTGRSGRWADIAKNECGLHS